MTNILHVRGLVVLLKTYIQFTKCLVMICCLSGGNIAAQIDLNTLDSPSEPQKKVAIGDKTKISSNWKQHNNGTLDAVLSKLETEFGLPRGLLRAIAKIESNYNIYAINAGGHGHYFKTAEEAASFVDDYLSQGKKNISVGCLQLLYTAHKQAFGNSVINMLDPDRNAGYAAKYLRDLKKRYGNWKTAVKRFHSSNPRYGEIYLNKVLNTGYVKDLL